MYFLDPERGRRRRALVRDRIAHAAHVSGDAVGATGRDVAHRTTGAAARLRGLVRSRPVDDRVLAERVRAQLGRLVSHPHAIRVDAANGVVTLRGPVLEAEVPQLLGGIERIGGVRSVTPELEAHEHAGNVPALQGGAGRPQGQRMEIFQRQWSPATRLAAGTTGVALAGYAASRRGVPGALLAAAGVGLAARAATNVDVRRLSGLGGGRRGIDVQKTITVDAPVEEVFAFWSDYANFPRFLSRVLDVRQSGRTDQSHWTVAGPAGAPVEFDAEVTTWIPNEALGWRTVKGSPIAHEGLVRFEPTRDGRTRIHIRMSYNPPGGWIGHTLATAFGADPKTSLDADLARVKTLLETGRVARDAAQR
jgi:uncharacterized membrane protein